MGRCSGVDESSEVDVCLCGLFFFIGTGGGIESGPDEACGMESEPDKWLIIGGGGF